MKSRRILSPLAVILAVSCNLAEPEMIPIDSPFSPDQITSANLSGELVPGVIRIKFNECPSSISEVPELIPEMGVISVRRTFPSDARFIEREKEAGLDLWYDIVFDENIPVTKAASGILQNKNIVEVEGIRLSEPAVAWPFNDPSINRQWHYANDGSRRNSVAGADANVLDAWNVETGSENVIVAVIDAGVRYSHEDLRDAMWVNTAEAQGTTGVDDDGNGYVDDIYGFNFCGDSDHMLGKILPDDHGTHVAGTIAAVNNNGLGGAGIAGGNGEHKGARIMGCQIIMDGNFGGNTPAAFKYAADNGAVIANNSWSYSDQSIGGIQSSLREAIEYFKRYAGFDANGNQVGPMAGGIVFFAAGNESTNTSWPSQYEGVFAVSAIASNWNAAYYTNYGSWVDIAAPGGDAQLGPQVYSTTAGNDSSYDSLQGTSMACPHVSGVAALVVSHFGGPGFTSEKLWDILSNSANSTDLYSYNTGKAGKLGIGMVNAAAALANEGPLPPAEVEGVEASSNANQITVSWKVATDPESGKAARNAIFYSEKSLADFKVTSDGKASDENVAKVMAPSGVAKAGDRISHNIDGLKFGTLYHIRICAVDNLDNYGPLSDEITVKTMNNNKPVLTAVNGTNVSIKEHEKAVLNFNVSDPDGHTVSVALDKSFNGMELSPIENGKCSISFYGKTLGAGKYDVVLTASDGYEETSLNISCSVDENHSPVTTGTMENIVFNGKGEKKEMDLTQFFNDPDGENLSYSASSSSTSIIFKTDIKENRLVVESNWFGTATMTVTATDAFGKSVSQDVIVLVRDGSSAIDLYPNPVKDFLNVRAGSDITFDICIYSGTGAKVFDSSVSTSPFKPGQIDMSEYPDGSYTVIAKWQNGEEKHVIIKSAGK